MNELVCLKKVSLLLHRRYIQKSIVTWKLVFFFLYIFASPVSTDLHSLWVSPGEDFVLHLPRCGQDKSHVRSHSNFGR